MHYRFGIGKVFGPILRGCPVEIRKAAIGKLIKEITDPRFGQASSDRIFAVEKRAIATGAAFGRPGAIASDLALLVDD